MRARPLTVLLENVMVFTQVFSETIVEKFSTITFVMSPFELSVGDA